MKFALVFSSLGQLALVSLILALVYLSVQQTYRMGANDPQIQLAQDMAAGLSAGRLADIDLKEDSLDISQSLGVFTLLLSPSGQPVRSNGFLHGAIPRIPAGVLDFVNRNGDNRISWQPEPGVRVALVVEKVSTPAIGFVAVGRSLQEVEIREKNLGQMVFIGWLICCGIIIVHALFQYKGGTRWNSEIG